MECKFTVGQRVVCVDTSPNYQWMGHARELTVGNIYTISKLYPRQDGLILVKLKEFPMLRGGWCHLRFKPIENKKTETNISVFTKILDKVNGGNHDNTYNFNLDELYETEKK